MISNFQIPVIDLSNGRISRVAAGTVANSSAPTEADPSTSAHVTTSSPTAAHVTTAPTAPFAVTATPTPTATPAATSSTTFDERDLCDQLVSYLRTTGFVYLVNHGVDASVISSTDFFHADAAFKATFQRSVEGTYVGFKPLESERFNASSYVEDAREALLFDAHRIGRNAWPTKELNDATAPLIRSLGCLARKILRMIGVGLGLDDPEVINELHGFQRDDNDALDDAVDVDDRRPGSSYTVFRFNHYPILPADGLKHGQTRCGEHKDVGTVTLLLQDDVPGLEICVDDDDDDGDEPRERYIGVTPMDGAILLNIGVMLERVVNGRIRACKHRVTSTGCSEERLSMIFFAQPDNDAPVEPLPELLIDGEEIKYKKVTSLEFVGEYLKMTGLG